MAAERDGAARLIARMDARWDAAEVERALGRVHREVRRRRVRALLGASALAAAAAAFVVAWPGGPQPLARRASTIELADGSRIEQSEDGAAVLEEVSPSRVRVRAARGVIRCDVTRRPERTFEVRAGDVTVTVLGTAFSVELVEDARMRVVVERGRVRVAWPGGRTELAAGEQGTFPDGASELSMSEPPERDAESSEGDAALGDTEPSEGDAELSDGDGAPGNAVPTAVASVPATAASRAHRAVAEAPAEVEAPALEGNWRLLARAERYDDAFVALRDEPAVDRVEDLLLAADVARLSGHLTAALPYLDRVLAEHPADARAPVASFTRGRLLAQLGRHREAAVELTRAHAMDPRGSLAEDALGRAALEHASAGDHAAAREAASRYLSAHPEGRWAPRVRALLEAPSN